MDVRTLFEAELHQRDIAFTIESVSDRYAVKTGAGQSLVSLNNLARDFGRDGDVGRISRFVDAILASTAVSEEPISVDQLYWCLEPNDHHEPADFRAAVSDRVDRVLVTLSPDRRLITWVTPAMLDTLKITEADASAAAFANLATMLSEAKVECHDIDGVQLGMLGSILPFKASLILSPNLKEVLGTKLGWPLLAVVPDREFLYLWAARHAEFAGRVGPVVVGEYSKASYPISTEVFEITDGDLRAIGEFPTGQSKPE